METDKATTVEGSGCPDEEALHIADKLQSFEKKNFEQIDTSKDIPSSKNVCETKSIRKSSNKPQPWSAKDRENLTHEWRGKFLDKSFLLAEKAVMYGVAFAFLRASGWIEASDTIIITILTTATANVLGILTIAFHWLYPKQKNNQGD